MTAEEAFQKLAREVGADGTASLPMNEDFYMAFEDIFDLDEQLPQAAKAALEATLDRNKDGHVSKLEFKSFYRLWAKSKQPMAGHVASLASSTQAAPGVPLAKPTLAQSETLSVPKVSPVDLTQRVDKNAALVQSGLSVVSFALKAGAELPVIGGAFVILNGIVIGAQALMEQVRDLAEAYNCALCVGQLLELLCETLEKLPREKQEKADGMLKPLLEDLRDFKERCDAFKQKGWYRKVWTARGALKVRGPRHAASRPSAHTLGHFQLLTPLDRSLARA